jgi:hypothetical protein
MSEAQTAMGAEHHGKMFLAATIGKHPARAATVMSILIILTIVLIGSSVMYHARWKSCANPKSGFQAAGMVPISNFAMGTNNPLWQRGSMATGGLLEHDDVTDTQASAYVISLQPPVQRHMAQRAAYARLARTAARAAAGREGMRGGRREKWYSPPPGGMCKSGDVLVTDDIDPSGKRVGQCGSAAEVNAMQMDEIPDPDIDMDPDSPDIGSCGDQWDPEAALETQALAATGGFAPATYGVARLEDAAVGVLDTSRGLSDAQLTTLMRYGRTP